MHAIVVIKTQALSALSVDGHRLLGYARGVHGAEEPPPPAKQQSISQVESGRTKIKNIELGKQHVSIEDLKCIARVMGVPLEQLQPLQGKKNLDSAPEKMGILISQKVAAMFPGLREYLDMLEKASMINDSGLIVYLSEKIADIWQNGPKLNMESPKRNIKTVEERVDYG